MNSNALGSTPHLRAIRLKGPEGFVFFFFSLPLRSSHVKKSDQFVSQGDPGGPRAKGQVRILRSRILFGHRYQGTGSLFEPFRENNAGRLYPAAQSSRRDLSTWGPSTTAGALKPSKEHPTVGPDSRPQGASGVSQCCEIDASRTLPDRRQHSRHSG